MLKHVRIKALTAATVAGVSLRPGQIVELDLEQSQIDEASANADLAIDDGSPKGTDLSAVKANIGANPADNAPKANGPMHGFGVVEVTPPGAKGTGDAATNSDAIDADAASKNKASKSK